MKNRIELLNRPHDRMNDYITRKEAHQLFVHLMNDVFRQMSEAANAEPPKTDTTEPNTFTLDKWPE